MNKPKSKSAKVFQAVTILRKGRLSKTHMADPKDGLSLDDKKSQEVPVKVALIPVAELNPSTCEEFDDVETRMGSRGISGDTGAGGGVGKTDAPGGLGIRQWRSSDDAVEPTAGIGIRDQEKDEHFARPGDIDGNVA